MLIESVISDEKARHRIGIESRKIVMDSFTSKTIGEKFRTLFIEEGWIEK